MSEAIKGTSIIETSSTTNRSHASGLVSQRLKPPLRGSASSRRWMVLAPNPVLSAKRFAARPVGAHSATVTDFAHRILRMEFTRVVLPTPGPTGHDQQLVGERQRDRRPLTHRKCHPEFLLDPSDSALGIDHWPWRPLMDKRLEPVGDESFSAPEIRQKNTAARVDQVCHHRAGCQLRLQRFG